MSRELLVKGVRVKIVAPPHNSKRALATNEVFDQTGVITREGSSANGGWFEIRLDGHKDKYVYYRRGALRKVVNDGHQNEVVDDVDAFRPNDVADSDIDSENVSDDHEGPARSHHINTVDSEDESLLNSDSDAHSQSDERSTLGADPELEHIHDLPSPQHSQKQMPAASASSFSARLPAAALSHAGLSHSSGLGSLQHVALRHAPSAAGSFLKLGLEAERDLGPFPRPVSMGSNGDDVALSHYAKVDRQERRNRRKSAHPYRSIFLCDRSAVSTMGQGPEFRGPSVASTACTSVSRGFGTGADAGLAGVGFLHFIGAPVQPTGLRCASCKASQCAYWHLAHTNTLNAVLCNSCGVRFRKYQRSCVGCNYVMNRDELGTKTCPRCAAPLQRVPPRRLLTQL